MRDASMVAGILPLLVGLLVSGVRGADSAEMVPAEFGVCVTTTDANGESRLDSYWPTDVDAKARRTAILKNGWIKQGDEWDREDEYPPHSIVKVTIDPTLINNFGCTK